MEPVSAAASVIACYQLASEVVCQCLRYVRGVRQAKKDGDFVVAQIQTFQLYLHHLQGMLANEAANPIGGSRLKLLREIMIGNSAPLLLCSKELEELQTKLIKAQSGGMHREVFHKLSWPLKQDEVDRAVTTLNNFAAAVDRGLAIDTNEVLRGIDSTTKDTNSITKQILISSESAEDQQKRREELREREEERRKAEEIRGKILDWLAHPDPSEIQNIASRARKSTKTGRWFLDGAAFHTFKESPGSILWLHGDSGCGKSILCSAIIDELRAIQTKEARIRIAYWYFSLNDANRRSLQNLVRALITQLCPSSMAPPALVKFWDANRKGRDTPQVSDSIQTLLHVIGEISVDEARLPIFIVIDALDEANEAERAEIIDMFQRILSISVDLHVLVTSRSNIIGIEQRLQHLVRPMNVVIERQYVDKDIHTHITERLQNDESLNKWPSYTQEEIKETLVAGAAGMFRWVDCQLHAIRRCSRCRKPKELRKVLTSLPKDMHEVYAGELANVEDHAIEDVRKLLGWITYPQRPLRIEEAAEMLAVDLDSNPPCFDEGNRMPCPEDILSICGSLVRVDQNPKGRNSLGKRAKVQTLTAAHSSVVDFLKEKRVQIGRELEVFYTRAAVNLEMAETCLAYLLEFVEGKRAIHYDNIMSYPLARFSAELWDDFYREIVASSRESEVDMTRVNALVMRLFASRETMLKWIQLGDPDDDYFQVQFDLEVSDVKSALYYAALLGLPDIVRRFLEDGHFVDEIEDGGCGTPLTAACVYGRENIVSILLEHGADPNLFGNRYEGCPLVAAIENKNNKIVDLLLRTQGVNVNARRSSHYPAVTLDALRIELMKETGKLEEPYAGMTIQESTPILMSELPDYSYLSSRKSAETVLYIAAKSGSLDVVNALLEAEAEPNILGGDECTPLQIACCGGSADIVETLLKHGANANIRGGKSGSPLQAASACPSLRTVKLLVAAHVDVNYVGDGNLSALYLASTARDLEMVELLLKHGASTNLFGGYYDDLLQIASKNGDVAIVRALLNAGFDINREGGPFGTALCGEFDNALQTACHAANANIVLQLLENGTDPNLHGGWYGSALHAAFSRRNEVIIRKLLTKGADARYRGGGYHNVLQAAVESGTEMAVRIALECGMSPNERGGEYTYPLLRAIALDGCPDSVVRLLLEAGADPNLEREGDDFTDKMFRTALQHATSVSKTRLLLENGAKVNTVSGWVGTALHAASVSGLTQRSTMIKLLLEYGSDINQVVGNIGSPLCYVCSVADLDSARFLIEAGADRDLVDAVGHSPLHLAICASGNSEELFEYLVGLGAEPLLLDRRGCNGLHYAARANDLSVLKKIIKRGCDVNSTDGFGWTPLHWAAASTRRSAEVVKALLQEGCNIDRKDRDERTALNLATSFKNIELVAILNKNGKANITQKNVTTEPRDPMDWSCDGCLIKPQFCGSEDWYECLDCDIPYDLCFRCIEDKDVIHTDGHSWVARSSKKVTDESATDEEQEA